MADGPGDFFGMTVEHLFGEVWTREGLSMRDRRLLLIGLLTGLGLDDVLGIQFDATLRLEELSPEEIYKRVKPVDDLFGLPRYGRMSGRVQELGASLPENKADLQVR